MDETDERTLVNLLVDDKTFDPGSKLPASWSKWDEWYNFKNFNTDVKVLIKVDETSYEGGKMKNDHPISWYHTYDGGRVFYTALGHTEACYIDPIYLKHLLAGIKWVMN